jgi:hypothetical protein
MWLGFFFYILYPLFDDFNTFFRTYAPDCDED